MSHCTSTHDGSSVDRQSSAPTGALEGATTWSRPSGDDVLVGLASQRGGLTNDDAALRRARHGENLLPRPRRRHWSIALLRNFVSLFAVLLWVAAVLAAFVGMPELGIAIVFIVIVNGVFAFWQEHQAERAVEALAAMLPDRVLVRREGRECEVSASAVVPGDILVLAAGALVTADARVLQADELRVDLSALTGESRPVTRTVDAVEPGDRPAAQLPNLVFAGTTIASGRGEAVVFATGTQTELGRIAALTGRQDPRTSPLERELARVIRVVTVLAVAMGASFFALGVLQGDIGTTAAFVFAIGIIVANVPEGLMPTLTLALALGVRRMANRRALVKRLSSVETLGATTVILTDKTGTLTENEMTVRELFCARRVVRVTGSGYAVDGALVDDDGVPHEDGRELLRIAALCCDARIDRGTDEPSWRPLGDPTEVAILVAAHKGGVSDDASQRWPRIATLPFDSVRKRMTTIHENDGHPIACTKGAPNEVLPRCTTVVVGGRALPLEETERAEIAREHERMAGRGLRVLAVARRSVSPRRSAHDGWSVDTVERGLEFLGLIAMEDPPRPQVPAAIAACRRAGVRVHMVTGDSGLTASAIAARSACATTRRPSSRAGSSTR
jgi:Ca2+-transporting ATPase